MPFVPKMLQKLVRRQITHQEQITSAHLITKGWTLQLDLKPTTETNHDQLRPIIRHENTFVEVEKNPERDVSATDCSK